jgi:hypothetical protein
MKPVREIHGHARKRRLSPTYRSWANMISRCTHPKNKNWNRYGGRGIKVCDKWRLSFKAFLQDMGEKPQGLTIDRIDNSGNYEPGNCRWATVQEQMQNTCQTKLLQFGGESMGLAAWGRKLGIKKETILDRLRRGWGLEKTLTTRRVAPWAVKKGRV